jgi:hypothetical protein
MENSNNKLTIGDYVLINNKYIGYIVKTIWNSNGYIIRLEDNEDYVDKTLSQYELLPSDKLYGHMLVTLNDSIKKINFEQIQDFLLNYDIKEINNVVKKINNKYENFLKKISSLKNNSNQDQKSNILFNNVYNVDKFPIYNYQAGQEEDYKLYITKMINELFIDNNQSIWEEDFYIGDSKSIDLLGDENIDDIIKPALVLLLENFDQIKISNQFNFKNTLMYKHLIYDNQMDMLSLGKEFIGIIKKELLKFQEEIILDEYSNILESTNLFDFLNFKIVGEYIEITSNFNGNDFRVITPELVSDLKDLAFQYSKPIDYNYLSTIVLQNKTSEDVIINKEMIEEALKILSQEYIICFQPKVEVLLWTISKLIISWYADPKLWENIFKIKILINLFRARGIKEFNKDHNVQPVIMIIPKYGKKIATKVLSHLSYFFFPYKKIGWEKSSPTWFDKLDNLMYYTNGSLQFKKYIKFLLSIQSKFNNPLTKDMTQINLPNHDNKIEYQIPNNGDMVLHLDIEKFKLN